MARIFIGLGGNVGNVEETFRLALQQLDASGLAVVRMSSIHATAPVGAHAGEPFRNAVAELVSQMDPPAVLTRLQSIESRLGRTRETRWGPRTIDLDVVLHGDRVIQEPGLCVPHPACWYRRFVLDPFCEIAPEVIHPVKRIAISDLRCRLLRQPFRIALSGGIRGQRVEICEHLQKRWPDVRFRSDWSMQEQDPTLIGWLGAPADGLRSVHTVSRSEDADAHESMSFADLPLIPRLDMSLTGNPCEFLNDVIASATHD